MTIKVKQSHPHLYIMNKDEGMAFLTAQPNLKDYMRNHFSVNVDDNNEENEIEKWLSLNLKFNCFWIASDSVNGLIHLFFESDIDAAGFKLTFM